MALRIILFSKSFYVAKISEESINDCHYGVDSGDLVDIISAIHETIEDNFQIIMNLNKQIELLKQALEKTTKFDDEQEKIDYILDVTNEYKQLLLKNVNYDKNLISSDSLLKEKMKIFFSK